METTSHATPSSGRVHPSPLGGSFGCSSSKVHDLPPTCPRSTQRRPRRHHRGCGAGTDGERWTLGGRGGRRWVASRVIHVRRPARELCASSMCWAASRPWREHARTREPASSIASCGTIGRAARRHRAAAGAPRRRLRSSQGGGAGRPRTRSTPCPWLWQSGRSSEGTTWSRRSERRWKETTGFSPTPMRPFLRASARATSSFPP